MNERNREISNCEVAVKSLEFNVKIFKKVEFRFEKRKCLTNYIFISNYFLS